MAQPPIYNNFFDADNKTISGAWKNYINSITRITGLVIVNDWIIDAISGNRTNQVATWVAPRFTESERDRLENAWDGMVIYNTDTNKINFRENGIWVTFTAIPA